MCKILYILNFNEKPTTRIILFYLFFQVMFARMLAKCQVLCSFLSLRKYINQISLKHLFYHFGCFKHRLWQPKTNYQFRLRQHLFAICKYIFLVYMKYKTAQIRRLTINFQLFFTRAVLILRTQTVHFLLRWRAQLLIWTHCLITCLV